MSRYFSPWTVLISIAATGVSPFSSCLFRLFRPDCLPAPDHVYYDDTLPTLDVTGKKARPAYHVLILLCIAIYYTHTAELLLVA